PDGGFAVIFGLDGPPLVEPIDPGDEGTLYTDIDLQNRDFATNMIDVAGHYSIPKRRSM
ncbi:hypothetical protein LTR16_003672, partial [Cryomyces antarcticus]